MLGLDRRAACYTWTAALIIILLLTVYLIRSTLFVFDDQRSGTPDKPA